MLVVNVAVRKRISVLGVGVEDCAVIDLACGQCLVERGTNRRTRERVVLGKAAIEFTAKLSRQTVRRASAVGDEWSTVKARGGDETLGKSRPCADHEVPAHAVADRPDRSRSHRLALADKIEQCPAV